jgi:hypothetical protein
MFSSPTKIAVNKQISQTATITEIIKYLLLIHHFSITKNMLCT